MNNCVISLLSDDETTDNEVGLPKKRLKRRSPRLNFSNGRQRRSKPVTIIDSIALSDDEEPESVKCSIPSLNNEPSVSEKAVCEVESKKEGFESDALQKSDDDVVLVVEEKSEPNNSSPVVSDQVACKSRFEDKKEEEASSSGENNKSNLCGDFDAFFNKCAELLDSSKFKDIYNKKRVKLEKLYRALSKRDKLGNFEEIVQSEMENLKDSESAFVSFTRVFVYLSDSYKDCEVINKDLLEKIKRLEKVARVLYKRIRQLEETPVDFDEDGDSAYIQLSTYKSKYLKVDAKLCQLYDIDAGCERVIRTPLNFCDSSYPLINKAVKVKYNKTNDSPDYYGFNKYVRKYLKTKNFVISESELSNELKVCFQSLCKLMEQRRKRDLYDVHQGYLEKEVDIEFTDPELCTKLENNRREGESRMNEVLRKYTLLQEEGKKVTISSDSDDSNIGESDLDEQENGD